ncbi:hypothetical protein BDQ17DRAFT_508051 [Cyathus striatus]|nr:hypothetical protein BDQ17DRAFT_508051 [Cyathus striatus]
MKAACILFNYFIGFVVSLLCLGIVVLQCWNYFTSSFKDRLRLRIFVIVILMLSITSSCINVATVYNVLITMKRPDSMFIASVPNSGVLFFLVHTFFATRVFLLTKRLPVPVAILIDETFEDSVIKTNPLSDSYFRKKKLPVDLFHAFAVVADLIVSVNFSSALMISRSNIISNGQTAQVLKKLLRASVTRGIVLAAVQIFHLILFILKPNNMFLWAPVHMILDQLYTITTLMLLNSRTFSSDRVGSVVEMSYIEFASVSAE